MTGNITSKDQPPKPPSALRYCLDPSAFTSLDANARRAFLFDLMGVKMSAQSIADQLIARGHPEALVNEVLPFLRTWFSAACKHVKERATLLRGEWRGVTGEDYGSVKAEGWSSEAPEADTFHMETLKQDIARFDREIGELRSRHGALTERAAERQRLTKRMAQTRRIAGECEARQNAVKDLRTQIDKLTAEELDVSERLEKAQAALTIESHAVQGSFFQCPACGESLVYSRGECKVGKPVAVDMSAEIAGAQSHATELKLALNEIRDRKRIADKLLVDAINSMAQSQAAADALKDLNEPQESDDAEADADIEETIAVKTAARFAAQQALDRLEMAVHVHNEAVAKTSRARAIHEDIKAVITLVADLAPDGLPAELLAKAMRPINERLRDSAAALGFHPVTVDTEGILIHGRHWDLASASEQWRANAIIAEAISHLSGLKIFTLDGFDVLAPAGRAVFLAWLISIAHEHDTIIVLGTLKQAPAGLPLEVQSCWLGEVPDEMLSC